MAREPAFEEILCESSGVTVIVSPFPADLWNSLQARAERDNPDPEPPKKTIKVVDGTEEIDDLSDPAYQEALGAARLARSAFIGECVLDICVQVKDPDAWEGKVERLARYTDMSDDPEDRRLVFLRQYALRTADDFERAIESAYLQMMVTDKEVAARVRSFRREMARAASDVPVAPGSDEEERVDVQPEVPGD